MNDAVHQIGALHRQLRGLALALTGTSSDADELVKEVFETAIQQWDSFNGESLLAWTSRLLTAAFAVNSESAWHRYRYQEISETDLNNIVGVHASSEQKLKLRETLKAVAGLGKTCREMLILSALGYGIREISEMLDLPIGTAGRRMMECRQRLLAAPNLQKEA